MKPEFKKLTHDAPVDGPRDGSEVTTKTREKDAPTFAARPVCVVGIILSLPPPPPACENRISAVGELSLHKKYRGVSVSGDREEWKTRV